MQHAIWNMIDEEEPLTSVKIEGIVDTTTPVMNELIGLVVNQENIPQEGFKELCLSTLNGGLNQPLDDSVTQSLLSKCQALNTLKLNEIHILPDHMKDFFAQQCAIILTTNS